MAKKQKPKRPEFVLHTILNDPKTKTQVRGFVEEIGELRKTQRSAADAIRDTKIEAADSLGMPGKVLNKLVKEWETEGTIDGEMNQLEEIKQIAEAIKK